MTTLIDEFKKLAIQGHASHTGRDVDKTKFEDLARCTYSFCKVRHELVEQYEVREVELAHAQNPLAQMPTTTSLPEVISNTEGLYEGNLEHYLRILFSHAQNLWFPYHNFRHMLHVTWMAYQGCQFYRDDLLPRQMRNVLIGAIFHDFDHSGMLGHDDLNIERAIRGLHAHVHPDDVPYRYAIEEMIRATQYPTPSGVSSDLTANILRDADLSQAFSTAWVQQVVFGLAAEWRQSPLEVLRKQHGFLSSLQLKTTWARNLFPQSVIDAKIAEAQALLTILEESK